MQFEGTLKIHIYSCVCIHIQIDKKSQLLHVNTIRRKLRNLENFYGKKKREEDAKEQERANSSSGQLGGEVRGSPQASVLLWVFSLVY